jgi:hypothetical protein
MSEEKTSDFDTIKNYLPFVSIALISMGMFVQIFFYRYFNIDIVYYIDFTEIFQIRFLYFAIVIVYIAFAVAVPNAAEGHFETNKFSYKRKMTLGVIRFRKTLFYKWLPKAFWQPFLRDRLPKIGKRLSTWVQHLVFFFVVLIIIVIAGFIDAEASVDNQSWADALLSLALLIIIIYISIGVAINSVSEDKGNVKSLIIKTAFIVVFFGGIFSGIVFVRANAYEIKHGKPEYLAKMIFKGKSTISDTSFIKTDTVMVYIGQTRNFVFVYDRNSSSSHVIPKSEISAMQFFESPSEKRIKKQYETITSKRFHWSNLNKYIHNSTK